MGGCARAGAVDKALSYLDVMKTQYSLEPTIKHYSCVVDAYGRAGRFTEAEEYIAKMPIKPDIITYITLLRSCIFKNDVKTAERVVSKARQLNPNDRELESLTSLIAKMKDKK